MAVTLSEAVLASIREHGAETYPNECCGALIGSNGLVLESFALPNMTALLSESNRTKQCDAVLFRTDTICRGQ